MIDVTKPTTTRDGRKVVELRYKPLNDAGAEVTYPIKGWVLQKGKQPEYCIWSIDGKYDVVHGNGSNSDLVQ